MSDSAIHPAQRPGSSDACDVLIIGAGVSGANIARRLSSYELDVALVDKEADVSFGVSKANSGIVHGGFHHNGKYLKAKFELRGSMMFDRLKAELDFPFERCGIVVAAMHEDEMRSVEQLYMQGVENGTIGIEMCSRERMLELEPKLSPDTVGGLYAPGGGIVEPYRFVFSLVESALKNGLHLETGWRAASAMREGDWWRVEAVDGRSTPRYVVNAAGLFADEVSRPSARRVQYSGSKGGILPARPADQSQAEPSLFPVPTEDSKGVLISRRWKAPCCSAPRRPRWMKRGFRHYPSAARLHTQERAEHDPLHFESDVITSFAGIRSVLGEDFYIDLSAKVPALVQVAGIQSPGLTAGRR